MTIHSGFKRSVIVSETSTIRKKVSSQFGEERIHHIFERAQEKKKQQVMQLLARYFCFLKSSANLL